MVIIDIKQYTHVECIRCTKSILMTNKKLMTMSLKKFNGERGTNFYTTFSIDYSGHLSSKQLNLMAVMNINFSNVRTHIECWVHNVKDKQIMGTVSKKEELHFLQWTFVVNS